MSRIVTVGAVAVIGVGIALSAGVAQAHFALTSPPAYSEQDALGLPQKSAPCGQDDPGSPVVATNAVSTFHAGDTITITIDEKVFHPGHYRVALAQDQKSLPADPAVTVGATPCGSAAIEDSSTAGVIIDNQIPHTEMFTSPQSFSVTLPATTCTNCTLQVVEFMGDHPLNNPGGCFYHHCAQVNLVAPGTVITDAGVGSAAPPAKSGGCAAGGSAGGGGLVLVLAALASRRRR